MVSLTGVTARIPGHGTFTVTAEAAMMIEDFGGSLHCYQGPGGCRKQGLYFSRTEPKKYLRCLLTGVPGPGSGTETAIGQDDTPEILLSVSPDLAPKLDGAVLHFGNYNQMQRFPSGYRCPPSPVPLCVPQIHRQPRLENARPASMTPEQDSATSESPFPGAATRAVL